MFKDTIQKLKGLPPAVRYFVPLIPLAIIAAALIWWRGIDINYKTEAIAQTSTIDGAADQVQFLADGSFVTVKNGVGVFLWQTQEKQLRRRQVFDFARISAYLRLKELTLAATDRTAPSTPTATPTPSASPQLDIDPVVLPDGSKIVVCYKGFVAAFPHDWFGAEQDVQITRLDSAPTAMAANQDRIALAYGDSRIKFLSTRNLEVVYSYMANETGGSPSSVVVDRPSVMKFYGDLLAVVSITNATITFLNVKDLIKVTTERVVASPNTPKEHFRLAVSPQGRVAVRTDSPSANVTAADGSGPAYTTWTAYGTINDLAFLDNDNLLVGGAFKDVYVLTGKDLPYKLASAPGGVNTLAANADRIAFTGGDDVALFSYSKSWSPGKVAFIVGFAFVACVYVAFQLYKGRKQETLPPDESASADTESRRLPLPAVPPALVKAFRDGECVLYCGSGVSAQAGFPYWQSFIQDLTEWTINNKFVDRELGASLKAALAQGQYDSVSDNLVSKMRDRQPELNKYLSDIFLRRASLPDSVKLLKGLPFSAVMTTNFDNLLEQAFDDKSTASLTPADADLLLQCLHKREFFLLKLYGKLEKPDTVMLAPSQYEDFTRGNLVFSSFMETLLISRTVFFVGSSLEGIQGYLKGIGLSRQKRRTHYALVPVTGEAWQAKANPLNDRYGIEVLPYSPSSEDHPEVLKFLQNLDGELKEKSEGSTERREPETVLKRISVTDIGPFENLDLKFDRHWNILLGDNGVGKSSIIKAIAIAILGDDSKSYAQRIIKAGKPNSTITLESGRATYTTKLFRKNGEARVESIPGRAFEAEGWLAIAFPPLRTVSWVRPTSAETGTTGRERPTTDDLLPVIVGEADPRLDKLKQWIVNVDYRIKDAKSRDQDPEQFERLLNDFFDVVRELTEGTKIEFKEVNPATKEITVITDDGELPIEALSQGMTSLIGWVGILLQRLYEVYGKDDDDPKEHYALVLMDEIDAHLHPAWQQSLIRKLSKIFPNVQFIATTHSPLIVGGMNPDQIIRFARDEDDKVVTYTVTEEMTIGRADQILSSDLFGLPSTLRLTPEVEKSMKDYHDLMKKDRSQRTAAEEARFTELRETLKEKIPPVAETPAEQKAMRLVRALVESDGDGEHDRENQRLLARAEKLLDEVSKKPR